KTDIALLLFEDDGTPERQWMELLREHDIPVVLIVNKKDVRQDVDSLALRIEEKYGQVPVVVSAGEKSGMQGIFDAILAKLPEDFAERTITGNRVGEGDVVLLVMPQDIQAPKGRLILPQVQTIRELLDKKCIVVSCTTDRLSDSLQALARPPRLIITDSQAFPIVYRQKPAESSLTSFSVLFAAYKGDIEAFAEGASTIALLTPQSRVLIAEACTHAPLTEDIGTVKIPRLLRKRIGEELQIDFVSGNDFPHDLSRYDLIIHCGACMFNRKYVLSRIAQARAQHIPITNYGMAIAYLTGILDKIVW
ncbi:MAG: [FeFe] hydrogenase H-cluster maturation GTPase HydF, partial [Bacteroides sp.]|nr:[FeFe] hydrogenase H-cluster maturation GTPase HydF [Bacteroides sp.]